MTVDNRIYDQLYKYMRPAPGLLRFFAMYLRKTEDILMDFEKHLAGLSSAPILTCGSPYLLLSVLLAQYNEETTVFLRLLPSCYMFFLFIELIWRQAIVSVL